MSRFNQLAGELDLLLVLGLVGLAVKLVLLALVSRLRFVSPLPVARAVQERE